MNKIIHKIDMQNRYATQVGRSIRVYERCETGDDKLIKTFSPPKNWEHNWLWNFLAADVNQENAAGIYFSQK